MTREGMDEWPPATTTMRSRALHGGAVMLVLGRGRGVTLSAIVGVWGVVDRAGIELCVRAVMDGDPKLAVMDEDPSPVVVDGDRKPAVVDGDSSMAVPEGALSGPGIFHSCDAIAHDGEMCLLYANFDNIFPLTLKHGERFNCRFGHFAHDDMIGKPYGSRLVPSSGGVGHLYILHVSPTLWAIALRQRTQIVQPSDQAVIIGNLWLRPGSIVVESGTGSGALTVSLARTVAPSGHVHTFEFNENRVTLAQEEFRALHLDSVVTVTHGDACAEHGFGSVPNQTADAVMLDVPNPWVAIGNAARVLKVGGRICTYSPCIEQVQKSCSALRKAGFNSIKTLEVRLRNYAIKEDQVCIPGFEPPRGSTPAVDMQPPDVKNHKKRKRHQSSSVLRYDSIVRTRPFANTRGHTAFLTFASRQAETQ